jgi:trans-aconitate methyltransferase
MEFAEEHPSANVLGVDLSPIQPAVVPPNCSFRVDNAEAEWIADEKYDLIHSRAMIAGFKDWSKFIVQAFEYVNRNTN